MTQTNQRLSTYNRRPGSLRPQLEPLEPRCLLAVAAISAPVFHITRLVSDEAGVAPIRDRNLVNAWGIALSPTGGNFWISDAETGVSTLYSGDVSGQPLAKNPLVVRIPGGEPTGQVFNGSTDFVVSDGHTSGPAIFIFVSETGKVTGWNPSVPGGGLSSQAQLAASVPGAIFKGVTIGQVRGANYLYATDFSQNKIVVFDKAFHQTTLGGTFRDPNLPKGFAPFNIQNFDNKLYVTYARQDADKKDDVPGAGNGFVDVFDTSGHLLKRLISHGQLNSPWGMTVVPDGLGPFSGILLVGNFGNGRINAFNPRTGEFLGTLMNSSGHALQVEGLWGLTFGNGVTAGDAHTLYFTAGPDDEEHGLFGKINFVGPARSAEDAGAVAQGLAVGASSSAASVTLAKNPSSALPTGVVHSVQQRIAGALSDTQAADVVRFLRQHGRQLINLINHGAADQFFIELGQKVGPQL